jgi:RHH-type transcriptional regulator, proline utilization regulon repressor / proline dehydrogenase / delta 1-pyrroline-5-carboxylate dehydrogenase
VREIGGELLAAARGGRGGILSRAFWSDKLMNWAMKDEAFKVQLFRFVDAFPMLRTPEQVHAHLVDYLSQPGVMLPPMLATGLKAGGLAKGMLTKTVAGQVEGMAERFIAGRDAESALPKLRGLWDEGIGFSVDLLGEACVSHAEASAYRERYLDLVGRLPELVGDWPGNDRLERDHLGPVPRANVSVKITSLHPRVDAIDFEGAVEGVVESVMPVLRAARSGEARGGEVRGGGDPDRRFAARTSGPAWGPVFINFDMEQHQVKDLTIAVFMRCCELLDLPAGIALQAYLRSGEEDVRRIVEWSKRTGRQVTVRLVKGAYWDYETIHAEQVGWPVPVWSRKEDTDACFERMTRQLIEASPRSKGEGGVKLALGSHNVRSMAVGLALLEKHGLPAEAMEVQMLHGMADALKGAVVERGLRLREYVPVGKMIPGMAYLVRRLLENTSNESWLKSGFMENAPVEVLLASPHVSGREGDSEGEVDPDRRFASRSADPAWGEDPGVEMIRSAPERHGLSVAVEGVGDDRAFFSEPVRDFADAGQRERFGEAVIREMGNRSSSESGQRGSSTRGETVAIDATVEDAREAVGRASEAFGGWRDMNARERSGMIVEAARLMRLRRDELAGVMVREAGKPWREADADVCEAIDFCEYYARQAVGLLEGRRLGRFVGEINHQWHEGRGVAAVISPWNFPMAICTGMTVAALATGNAAVVKPAEQTPAIAKRMCELLWEAGVGREVLHFLPGRGETVGAALVRDPRVALIAFTGSKAVGLDILAAAGVTDERQVQIKKVVCETGGKNAIVVDLSADLDEAVLGVRQSAFGFCGQKCSACSRVIVVDEVHDPFLKRLVESTRSLVIGDPADPGTDLGPVIDEEAAEKIRKYIEIWKTEGKLELGMEAPAGLAERVGKPYIGPHIFSGIRLEHRLANEEVFGPVLSVMRVRDFEEALAVANATGYKLTGGVFSRRPAHLERARREFRVGNLYLNSKITGALVGRQPFGGFGMSGTGSQAGGPGYLEQFVLSRVCSENAMRRGFAPGLDVE